jgi:hypothetical protein
MAGCIAQRAPYGSRRNGADGVPTGVNAPSTSSRSLLPTSLLTASPSVAKLCLPDLLFRCSFGRKHGTLLGDHPEVHLRLLVGLAGCPRLECRVWGTADAAVKVHLLPVPADPLVEPARRFGDRFAFHQARMLLDGAGGGELDSVNRRCSRRRIDHYRDERSVQHALECPFRHRGDCRAKAHCFSTSRAVTRMPPARRRSGQLRGHTSPQDHGTIVTPLTGASRPASRWQGAIAGAAARDVAS